MTLQALRFAGDPILETCLGGTHRMLQPEEGLAVARIQKALIDEGFSVGPSGADGSFGPNTGAAVNAYKVREGLTSSDAVVVT